MRYRFSTAHLPRTPAPARRRCLRGLVLALSLAAGAPTPAEDQDRNGWYLSADALLAYTSIDDISTDGTLAGSLKHDDHEDEVAGLVGAVGYKHRNLRGEIEYSWRYRFDLDTRVTTGYRMGFGYKNNLETQSVMLNLFWDFDNRSSWTPYVGGGLGYAYNDSDVTRRAFDEFTGQGFGFDDHNFAWSLMAGLNYHINRTWSVRAGYRYVDLGDVKMGDFPDGTRLVGGDYGSHDLTVGIRFSFD